MHGVAVHGGAGALPAGEAAAERETALRAGIARALDAAYAIVDGGGSALDAVVAAVRLLEDDPLFNAGRGAVLNHEGVAELDASIMDGRTLEAGAVAGVRHVRNPIELARAVMERSGHVLMVGSGAEEFALAQGFALVPNDYFRTDERQRALAAARPGAPALGTVGAVALDRLGNLAAATSTGGTARKRPGRVGDSALVGAGTYARNGCCAASATGSGEHFMRAVAAHDVCARMEYGGCTLVEAVHAVLHERLVPLGGSGGLIAVDARGNIAMDFCTEGMFRGARSADGRRTIALGREIASHRE